ncbi:MAG TPA: DNA polymerase Y family protein, partial [Thermoanaerobaculia bacterium]
LRSEPELTREALAVMEGNGNAARVVAATRLARSAGLRPGLTLPQARALCPKLVARPRDADCERAAQEALLEVAEAFSPRVEDAGEGIAYLDADGIERHYPGPSPELEMARALMNAAEAAGLPARVGIASSKLAARVASGLPDPPVVVPAGEEAAFLAPLPLQKLAPEVDVAETLERWGVRSVGDFAKLPPSRVASRLGRLGRELHSTARGLDPRPLMPRELPPAFHEGMSLEWPLVALEPFLFVGRAALDRLCQRLEARGFACRRLEIQMRLEPDGFQTRAIDLPAPTRDVKTLLTLVRLELEARPPGAPVAGFTFVAHPDRPREAQLSLYGPAALSPDKLAATLARLFALLGPDRVGSPRPVDGHRPERFALVGFSPPPPPETRREPRAGRGLLAVRVLRPPVEIEVLTTGQGEGDPEAPPVEIRSTPRAEEEKRPRVEGAVKVASGPWGLEEEWWAEDPAGRDYWDVEIAGRGLYRIYRERATGAWYADGIYD